MPLAQRSSSKSYNVERSQKYSVIYHSIFDYPLTKTELSHWETGNKVKRIKNDELRIMEKMGFYFVEGKEGTIIKRLAREKYSKRKMKIALRASSILARIPTIQMVAVTGALAMKNADDESDIDLMFVTKKGTLWLTRLMTVFLLLFTGFKTRRPKNNNQKDRLCLNMWMDESDLVIKKQNFFTAHEIAQIVPLVNKNKSYESFLYKNKWILEYWPGAVGIMGKELRIKEKKIGKPFIHNSLFFILRLTEAFAYKLQYLYMRSKMTRETVTPTRAFFHPFDWSKFMEGILK